MATIARRSVSGSSEASQSSTNAAKARPKAGPCTDVSASNASRCRRMVERSSDGFVADFTRPNTHRGLHRDDPQLPVADLAGPGRIGDRRRDLLDLIVGGEHLHFHLGKVGNTVLTA